MSAAITAAAGLWNFENNLQESDMKTWCSAWCAMALSLFVCRFSPAADSSPALPTQSHPFTDAYPGWHLSVQTYSFKEFSLLSAIEKAADLGLDFIEVYPNHKIGGPWPEMPFQDADPAARGAIQEKLQMHGIRIASYGVVHLGSDETDNREIFDLAKLWGIPVLTAEPELNANVFDLVETLCKEYEIKVAIHNHPKGDKSLYWNPDTVLDACKGRSEWIGACADTGHWMRSGIHPVEALKKLEGRIITLHLKDLNEFGNPKAHDLPWGTGKADMPAILGELHRQQFQGVFSAEYEYNWKNSVPELRQSFRNFNEMASKLHPSGWRDLLLPDLSNAELAPGSWTWEDGTLTLHPDLKSSLVTKETFGNFILDLEFKLAYDTNSGVFIRVGDPKDMVQTGIEIQILYARDKSRSDAPGKHDCGAVYDCLAPQAIVKMEPGEWYHMTITAVDHKIYVVVNDTPLIDMDLNLWTEAQKNPDGTKNKFKTAYKDMPRVGAIALQNHKTPVWYRNLRIKPLE